MRAFAVYSLLRLGLFLGTFVVVAGLWKLVSGADDVPVVWAAAIALLVSGVVSLFLLDRQRAEVARGVEARADRAKARFERLRAAEDADQPPG